MLLYPERLITCSSYEEESVDKGKCEEISMRFMALSFLFSFLMCQGIASADHLPEESLKRDTRNDISRY